MLAFTLFKFPNSFYFIYFFFVGKNTVFDVCIKKPVLFDLIPHNYDE